jgi:hypothetical protein
MSPAGSSKYGTLGINSSIATSGGTWLLTGGNGKPGGGLLKSGSSRPMTETSSYIQT